MPIGGADGIGYDEASPSDGEAAGLGDDRIRSLKTSLRQGLDSEHNWPSSGGNAVGFHRLGSGRPYYGPQSAVSSSGSDGRLMQASDSSRLFGVGSGGTTFLGGPTVISAGSFPGGLPQRHHWVEEFGRGITDSTGTVVVTIPNSGYSGVPYIFLQTEYKDSGSVGEANNSVIVRWPSATTFQVYSGRYDGVGFASSQSFFWRSIGSRVL